MVYVYLFLLLLCTYDLLHIVTQHSPSFQLGVSGLSDNEVVSLCSGHGYRNSTTGECTCINGFHGFYCQFLYCPFGKSWHSTPTASNTRNEEYVVCSNMGDCDDMTGQCQCRPGYEGRACERASCPRLPLSYMTSMYANVQQDISPEFKVVDGDGTINAVYTQLVHTTIGGSAVAGYDSFYTPCSGHGICRTMREAGLGFDGRNLVNPGVYYDQWDADKIQGCLCDKGWSGPDCSLRSCPKGRDPQDPTTATASNEQYTIECLADAGFFALEVFGKTTIPIPYNAGPNYLRHALRELSSVEGDVTVTMQEREDGMPALCGSTAATRTTFTFDTMPGTLPPIRLVTSLANSRQQTLSSRALALTGGTATIVMASVYTITCPVCTECHGTVNFEYKDSISDSVDITATGGAAALQTAIGAMTDLTEGGWHGLTVSVSITNTGAEDKICSSSGESVTEIKITSTSFGNIPGLEMIDGSYAESAGYVTLGFGNAKHNLVWTSPSGDGAVYECSNQGACDYNTGHCHCKKQDSNGVRILTARSSDSKGNRGPRADCGYLEYTPDYSCLYELGRDNGGLSMIREPVCNGHGECKSGFGSTGFCQCQDGWSGVSCGIASCPKGIAWFDEPISATKAHESIECSGQGICERSTGTCQCAEGFSGTACNIKDCPRGEDGEACSGHGYCENMFDIFRLYGFSYGEDIPFTKSHVHPQTWDALVMHQCLCYAKYSTSEYTMHPLRPAVGPKDAIGAWNTGALPFAGFTSWDCSKRLCPRGQSKTGKNSNFDSFGGGDSPIYKEMQRVVCTITASSSYWFDLTLYGHKTAKIYANDGVDAIKTAIEQNPNIGNVTISMDYSASGTACDPTNHGGAVGFVIIFDTEPQNLPTMTIALNDDSQSGNIAISSVQDGNSENLECNGDRVGYCDRDEGLCVCRADRCSSNHNMEIGNVGDCGYLVGSQQTLN
jgi:hypothetical protein